MLRTSAGVVNLNGKILLVPELAWQKKVQVIGCREVA